MFIPSVHHPGLLFSPAGTVYHKGTEKNKINKGTVSRDFRPFFRKTTLPGPLSLTGPEIMF